MVPDEITIIMDEIAQTANVVICWSLTAGIASGLVNIFNISTIKNWHLCAR